MGITAHCKALRNNGPGKVIMVDTLCEALDTLRMMPKSIPAEMASKYWYVSAQWHINCLANITSGIH